jgi:hypothetical protein
MTSEKISQLLDYVIQMSRHQQKLFFFAAMKTTQQSHVVAFIQGEGSPSSELNWPVRFSSKENNNIDKFRSNMIDLLDPGNGLVDELLSAELITDRQKQAIEALKTDSEKNEKILNVLRRKSVTDFYKFITCLHKPKTTSSLIPSRSRSGKY